MKKKLTALTLSLVLALSLVACGGKEEKTDTAKTEATTATTETSVASTETTKEVAPVVEPSEPEVEEEAPDEIKEEPLPTTKDAIWSYLLKNGQKGDYMISEDGLLMVYTGETDMSILGPIEIKDIDGKLYKVITMPVTDGTQRDGYALEHVESYLFIKTTDKEDVFELEIKLPNGTIEHLKNDIQPKPDANGEYRPHILFGMDYDKWAIDIDDFTNDSVKILINIDHDAAPPDNMESFWPVQKIIYDLNEKIAIASISGQTVFCTNYDSDYSDQYHDYTLVTD